MAGHITRNPNPEPEKPEPEKSDPYFGFQATVPEIIMGKSGSRLQYPNCPNNLKSAQLKYFQSPAHQAFYLRPSKPYPSPCPAAPHAEPREAVTADLVSTRRTSRRTLRARHRRRRPPRHRPAADRARLQAGRQPQLLTSRGGASDRGGEASNDLPPAAQVCDGDGGAVLTPASSSTCRPAAPPSSPSSCASGAQCLHGGSACASPLLPSSPSVLAYWSCKCKAFWGS